MLGNVLHQVGWSSPFFSSSQIQWLDNLSPDRFPSLIRLVARLHSQIDGTIARFVIQTTIRAIKTNPCAPKNFSKERDNRVITGSKKFVNPPLLIFNILLLLDLMVLCINVLTAFRANFFLSEYDSDGYRKVCP